MKKAFFGLIMVVTIVCFCGIIPSTADDNPQFIFGEETDVAEDTQPADATRAISSANYVKELYTSTARLSGESYNARATKVFSVGDAVYLTIRYYMANAGNRTAYYFITNAAGSVVTSAVTTVAVSAGARSTYKGLTISTPGTYVFTPVITSPTGHMIPQSGFTFIVE